MKNPMHHWMARAAAFARRPEVQAATHAVQSALSRQPSSGRPAGDAWMRHLPSIDAWRGKAPTDLRTPGGDFTRRGDIIDVPLPEADATDRSPPATPADLRRSVTREGESFFAGSHTEAAGQRDFKLYVPPHSADEPMPLVVMLHGCTQNPDDFAAGTAMNEAARHLGVCVLYPAQSQRANAHRCWNWFKHNHQERGRGEPAILVGMVKQVQTLVPIDPRRIYVAGLSAGGAMAAILGEAYPDVFAAIGVHSGLAAGSANDLSSAMAAMKSGGAAKTAGSVPSAAGERRPTIVFHGTADNVVHPLNGQQVAQAGAGTSPPTEESVKQVRGKRPATRRIYRNASGAVVSEHWVVEGAAHAWSGGRAAGSYTDAEGPDATAEMLRFFLSRSLP